MPRTSTTATGGGMRRYAYMQDGARVKLVQHQRAWVRG
jgi:hypothetical protein